MFEGEQADGCEWCGLLNKRKRKGKRERLYKWLADLEEREDLTNRLARLNGHLPGLAGL